MDILLITNKLKNYLTLKKMDRKIKIHKIDIRELQFQKHMLEQEFEYLQKEK